MVTKTSIKICIYILMEVVQWNLHLQKIQTMVFIVWAKIIYMIILRQIFQRFSGINLTPLNRMFVWILLLLITAVILLFPINMTIEYHPIQAPYLFDSLPLFSGLFCIWMLLILCLLFSRKDEGSGLNWENLALVSVFSLVFIGFWAVITPSGSYSDGIFNMGHVRWLVDKGSIPVGHDNLVYFDFPGMHLLTASLSLLTGLGIFGSRMLFLIVNAVLFCAVLYVLFAKLTKSARLAFLGVLVAIMGGTIIVDNITIFYPRALACTMLAGFLVMLCTSETRFFGTTVADRVLMLILFIAMTVSYFATAFLAPLILLGIYVVLALSREIPDRLSLRTIILLFFIVTAWEIYWTWHTFVSLATSLPSALKDIYTGGFLTFPQTLVQANIGGRLPLWATITRSLWWTLLGVSTILGIYNLFRLQKLSLQVKIATGGLMGVILLTIIGTFGTVGGQQFSRFFLYAPFFSVPLLLIFLKQSVTWGRTAIIVLSALLLVLSLPTFLSSVNTVTTDAIYPYECSTGEFIESHSQGDDESNVLLYGFDWASTAWVRYYTPDLQLKHVPEIVYYSGNEDEAWEKIDAILTSFLEGWTLPGKQKLLVISEKAQITLQHLQNIPPDDTKWEEIWKRLSNHNLIYNNGYIQIYAAKY